MIQIIAMCEYERNHLSTLSRLSDDDVDHIWSSVSCFIEKQMFLRKGVCIFGLGTFTFCQQKLNLGNKHILIQRPVFILSEKLSQYYGLKQIKPQATDVPVVPLNFSAVSARSPYDRDAVEGCVRETLHLLLRAACARQSVLHTFPGIGVLAFRQSRVKMMFCRDFISALDGTGELSAALTKRLETRNSGASERPSSFTLPSISAGEPLREEPPAARHTDREDGRESRPADGETETDLTDGLLDKSPSNTDRSSQCSAECMMGDQDPFCHKRRDEDVSGPAGGAVSIRTPERSAAGVTVTCADHRRAGQELCYVCMQRAQRNLPVYLSEESRRAEREQERVLMLNQHQKDLQYFQKEETDRQKKRADGQKVAAFNLGVAEAQRRRKAAACGQSHGSYIFAGRPCTADRLPPQRRFMQELMQEACRRRQTQTQTQQEQQRLDRLHLLQMSEEMALKRSQQLHEKHEMAETYRKALEKQSERRCSETAPGSDARPVFGLMDSNPAALAEQRRRAQKISEELMNTADGRRRDMLKKRLNEQKREREIMQRDHKEMLEERICRYEKRRQLQAACVENWQHSATMRHQREQEELNIRRFGGQTLTDQLGQYERCSRCKRSASNCGRTNIFRDTNYVSGSRLML